MTKKSSEELITCKHCKTEQKKALRCKECGEELVKATRRTSTY